MTVSFTQYHLPDGRKSQVSITLPLDVELKASLIQKKGYRFECEVLSTGDVSLTITDPEAKEDVAIEVVPNGEGVPDAVCQLINRFYDALQP